jgi:hypothetical protein
MGGRMWVESQVDRGSTFISLLLLPQIPRHYPLIPIIARLS